MPNADIPLELAELLGLAVDLATHAGTIVRDGQHGDLDVAAKSTPTDPVTDVDRAAERYLVEQLHRRRPGDAVIGEEGADREGSSGIRWLLDPIDGTVNFVYGLPQYAVSLAAERDGEAVVGCVHNPVSGETFMAVRGAGAWLGSRRLSATGPARAGCWPASCRAWRTFAGWARPRSTCASSPPAGWTRTTSRASLPGTWRPVCSSPARRARS
jgi:fructose-1,6-bisphosphatase/inositol monophosphatase family enzyme